VEAAMTMKHFSFAQVPSPSAFQSKTSVTFAFRKDDPLLTRMDKMLERYALRLRDGDGLRRRLILTELFLTCNAWIKRFHEPNKPRQDAEQMKCRYPGVLALFEVVVQTLAKALGTTPHEVANTIAEVFGRDMDQHGYERDTEDYAVAYLSRMQAQQFRIRFRGGRAWRYVEQQGNLRLEPLNSKALYVPIGRAGMDPSGRQSDDYAAFVMTVEREMFMSDQSPFTNHRHHSSYTQGKPVMMAGTMLVENGHIKAIRCDSGHYKPSEINLLGCLQALAMYGVVLRDVRLFDYKAGFLDMALPFMRAGLSWTAYTTAQAAELKRRADIVRQKLTLAGRKDFKDKPAPAPAIPWGSGTERIDAEVRRKVIHEMDQVFTPTELERFKQLFPGMKAPDATG
jgi:hypothetical protein